MQIFDVETTAIASIMLYPNLIADCGFDISVDEFQVKQNQIIYTAILDIVKDGGKSTPNTIWNLLRKDNKHLLIDEGYLFSLPKYAEPSVENIHYFKEEAITNKLQSFAYDLIGQSKSGNTGFEALESAISKLTNFHKSVTKKNNNQSLYEAMAKVLEEAKNPPVQDNFIYTPWRKLNDKIGSLMPGEIISIGAQPGMGKTDVVTQICQCAVMQGKPCGIVSVEMVPKSLAKRFAEKMLGIPTVVFRANKIKPEQIKHIESNLHQFSKDIDLACVTSTMSEEVIAHVRRMISEGKKLIVIDYLQSINFGTGKNSNLDLDIGNFYRVIKGLVLTHDITVIIISQLTKEAEHSKNSIPDRMSYFKGSGYIASHSDMVWTLWRPGYYNVNEDAQGNDISKTTRILSLKGRDGTNFKYIDLVWDGTKLVDEIKIEIEYENTEF